MGDQDGLGALEVGVAGHRGLAGGFGEGDEGLRPGGEAGGCGVDGVADEEAHVGRDLFVAAAAGVELESERTNFAGELEFDVVVDVFSLWRGGDDGGTDLLGAGVVVHFAAGSGDAVRPVGGAGAYGFETLQHLGEFFGREDAGGGDGLCVRHAGGDFLREETPVEGEAALPLLEGAVEGLAEAAGPHFGGLLLFGHLCLSS